MKYLIFSVILIFTAGACLKAAEVRGSLTTGAYVGTPYWSEKNLSGEANVDSTNKFVRMYNNLTLDSKLGDFSIHLSGSRSDGFNIEYKVFGDRPAQYSFEEKYHLEDTRIFRGYLQYDLDGLTLKAGRVQAYGRWLFASVDGGSAAFKLSNNLSVSALGGVDVKYGELYNNDNRKAVAYADLAYNLKNYGGKAKVLYSDEAWKAGIDLFGVYSGVRLSADFGFDFTNSRLFDGSIGLFGFAGEKFSWSANISRFTPYSWAHEFSESVDRIMAGATYKLFEGYDLSFRQMVSLNEENLDYLSYLYLNHKYFYVGVNYLGGGTGNERLGVSLGGNYSPWKCFRLNAGIASVDYLFAEYDNMERETSTASYLRLYYDLFSMLTLSANLNYYPDNDYLPQKYRGGLMLQYRFNEGGGI